MGSTIAHYPVRFTVIDNRMTRYVKIEPGWIILGGQSSFGLFLGLTEYDNCHPRRCSN
jgi:hypothetical protein